MLDENLCGLESICAALSSDIETRVLNLNKKVEEADRILTPRSISGGSKLQSNLVDMNSELEKDRVIHQLREEKEHYKNAYENLLLKLGIVQIEEFRAAITNSGGGSPTQLLNLETACMESLNSLKSRKLLLHNVLQGNNADVTSDLNFEPTDVIPAATSLKLRHPEESKTDQAQLQSMNLVKLNVAKSTFSSPDDKVCTGLSCELRQSTAPRTAAQSHRTALEVFASLDTNGDGVLSLSEMEGRLAQFGLAKEEIEQMFTLMDENCDNFVDRDEFALGFAKYQSLEQGGVSARELLRHWAAGKPNKLASKESSVAVCPSQCCPAPAHKIGLLKDEPRRVVFVGCTGSGKSSLCTVLTGQDLAKDASSFKIGSGARSETTGCTDPDCSYHWFGDEAEDMFKCIDTPGLNDSEGADEEHISNIISTMRRLEYVNAIVLVLNGTDPRFSKSLQDAIARFERAFCGETKRKVHENFYDNLIVCFQRWKTNPCALAERTVSNVTESQTAKSFCDQFRLKFPHVKNRAHDLKCVFVDSHDLDPERKAHHLRGLKDAIPNDVFRTADLEHIVPRLLGYDAVTQTIVEGQEIIVMKPRLVDDSVKVRSWHISPNLPPDLHFSQETGEISGVPRSHSAPLSYSVVAESVGGKSKPCIISNIEIKLSSAHVQSIVFRYRERIESRLQAAIPNLEMQTEAENLELVISGWDKQISDFVSEARTELGGQLKNMSQLGEIVALIVLGGSELKTSFENKLRAKYAKHSKAQHEARLKLEKLDHEIQRLMLAGTQDYHAFKRLTDALKGMAPAPESSASETLTKAQQWLEDITPTKCSNASCPHVGLRRDQSRHAQSCLFALPLITQKAVERTRQDDFSLGFELSATLVCNPEFEEFTGTYYQGPSEYLDDDEEGWFHRLDRKNQRILRIKYVSGRWLLTCWKEPYDETEILTGSDSETVDQANFDGFIMTPIEKLSWASTLGGTEGKLSRDSIKLIYFGGMWCPYCPPFTSKLKIFYDVVRKEVGKEVLEIIFVSNDRNEDAMLEYYGGHHGDWFAVPFEDRIIDQKLSEKYEVSGIPSLHVIGNDGEEVQYFKKGGQIDIRGLIRRLPESVSDAKGPALELYRFLKARYMSDVEGLLGLDYSTVVQAAKEARCYERCTANLVGDLKDIMCGNFADAARGLQMYLKTGPDWDEKANCTIEGMKAEVRRLIDCPDCAALQASELDKLGLQGSVVSHKHACLVEALKALRSGEDKLRSLRLDIEKLKDQALKAQLVEEINTVTASNELQRGTVESIRQELDGSGAWYYGCKGRSIKWPEHVRSPFMQPLCARCRRYRLDYTKISEDLNYVINEASIEKECFNGVRDYGRVGATLQTFMDSDEAQEAKLSAAEVASLRFYTSHSFGCINEALRDSDRAGAHPLPAIVTNIQNGLKKLRGVGANEKQAKEALVLWRGFRDTQQTDKFMAEGGTELAPMSTTTDVKVAVGYAVRKGQTGRALLFRIVTENNLQRGADLQWLSMFPGEAETLYPPLTYMQPTGRTQTVTVDGLDLTIVEVKVNMAAGA